MGREADVIVKRNSSRKKRSSCRSISITLEAAANPAAGCGAPGVYLESFFLSAYCIFIAAAAAGVCSLQRPDISADSDGHASVINDEGLLFRVLEYDKRAVIAQRQITSIVETDTWVLRRRGRILKT